MLNTNNDIGLITTDDYLVLYDFQNKLIIGVISLVEEKDFYHIGAIAAEKGYGYLLTKLAMTHIYPKPIMTDRDSSTTDAFVKVLSKMYKDGLSSGTLDRDDEFYVEFKNKSEAYNKLINTKFKFQDRKLYSDFINVTNKHIKDNPVDIVDLNNKSFDFFSKKLNNI